MHEQELGSDATWGPAGASVDHWQRVAERRRAIHVRMHVGTLSGTTVAAAALAALAAAFVPAEAGAHLRLRSFTITPSGGSPGSVISHRVAVRQRDTYHVHVLWARVTVRQTLSGLVVQQRDQRPTSPSRCFLLAPADAGPQGDSARRSKDTARGDGRLRLSDQALPGESRAPTRSVAGG